VIENPMLLPKIRSRALLDACRHMPCTLRVSSFVPQWQCAHQVTVVPCHIPTIGKGMGTKVSDLFVAAGCIHCHDIVDRRDIKAWTYITQHYPTAYADRILHGMCETQSRWIGMGLLTVEGMELVG
jgi:hypothetical protein